MISTARRADGAIVVREIDPAGERCWLFHPVRPGAPARISTAVNGHKGPFVALGHGSAPARIVLAATAAGWGCP